MPRQPVRASLPATLPVRLRCAGVRPYHRRLPASQPAEAASTLPAVVARGKAGFPAEEPRQMAGIRVAGLTAGPIYCRPFGPHGHQAIDIRIGFLQRLISRSYGVRAVQLRHPGFSISKLHIVPAPMSRCDMHLKTNGVGTPLVRGRQRRMRCRGTPRHLAARANCRPCGRILHKGSCNNAG
jgi:hypothetical protein